MVKSAACVIGIAISALAVGTLDYSIAAGVATDVVLVKLGGKTGHDGLKAPVRDVEDCARLAKVPPPPTPCTALPCGWVLNGTCWQAHKEPCWHTLCEIPVERQAKGRR